MAGASVGASVATGASVIAGASVGAGASVAAGPQAESRRANASMLTTNNRKVFISSSSKDYGFGFICFKSENKYLPEAHHLLLFNMGMERPIEFIRFFNEG
jgi:hypothetical protein